MCVFICVHEYVCVNMSVCMCLYACVHMSVYVFICMCVCVCVDVWERILKCEDDINWKGQFNPKYPEADSHPSELQFQNHLEELLNPAVERILTDLRNNNTTQQYQCWTKLSR